MAMQSRSAKVVDKDYEPTFDVYLLLLTTQPMKFVYICIIWLIQVMVGQVQSELTHQHTTASAPSSGTIKKPIFTKDSLPADQTVVAFLKWYKTHMQAVNQRPLVNQPIGRPYSVNLKNGETYLALLKSSHLLTDDYLNQWRTYFKERNTSFRRNPQDEGPPDGFEYDLVMLSQDVEKQMASLKSLRINKVTILRNQATVALTLLDTYEFKLVRQNNHWIINEILNVSAE